MQPRIQYATASHGVSVAFEDPVRLYEVRWREEA